MRKIVEKQNFLGGEGGPLLEGRSDLAQYQLGASKLRNFIALKSGGVTRRPGTRYMKTTENNQNARLLPFVSTYDTAEGMYVIEVQASSMSAIEASTGASKVIATGSSYGMIKDNIQYVQSADIMFLVDGSSQPLFIYRTNDLPPGVASIAGGLSLTVSPFIGAVLARATNREQHLSIPYRNPNIDTSHTMTISNAAVGSGRTLTSSSAFFVPGHVGTYMRIFNTGFVRIDAVATVGNNEPQTTATVAVVVALDSTSATDNWAEGAWSSYRGFPRTVTFYDGRLVFGGNLTQPDTFWASQVDDYFQMHSLTDNISDPKTFTLRSDRLNQIKWMSGGKKLTIGTTTSEWVGTFSDDGTNFFVQFNEETKHGSRYVQPKKIGSSIPFIQRSGQIIREMNFNFDEDNYTATDLNLFANHIGTIYPDSFDRAEIEDLDSILVGMDQQGSPFDLLWTFDSSGRLYGLTRDKQQQIASWHSHEIAGGVESEVPAYVQSICVMPSTNIGASPGVDRLWMCVKRTINGVEKYHVEYIDDIRDHRTISPRDGSRNNSFLDCSSIEVRASTTSFNGFSRFANDSCYIVAQDANGTIVQQGNIAVNGSGEITLSANATTVIAGLNVEAEIRPFPLEGGRDPEINGRSIKRIDTARIKMYQTYGLRIGMDRITRIDGEEQQDDFELIPFDMTSYPIFSTFTGTKEVSVPSDGSDVASFALAMEEPWPCTILSLSMRVVHNEV